MSITETGELAELARQVLALSDSRDAELAARLEGRRAGYAEGLAQAEAQRSAGYAEAIADVKAAEHGLVRLFRDIAEVEAARWHLCCYPCRLAGHRAGCRDCEDRTRETFADPMPGEYTPALASTRRGMTELVRGVA